VNSKELEKGIQTDLDKIRDLAEFLDGTVVDFSNLRRIAERGLRMAQDRADSHEYIDIFQHMLDEIERVNYQIGIH